MLQVLARTSPILGHARNKSGLCKDTSMNWRFFITLSWVLTGAYLTQPNVDTSRTPQSVETVSELQQMAMSAGH
jgi:hypothetical protein